MTARSLGARMERYGGGPIVVVDYDPTWPAQFERERVAIEAALGDMIAGVEHVGSTSVPGLPAKPIIDLLVGVRNLDEARRRAVAPLEALGYAYLPEYETLLPAELFFRKGMPWTHHAHVMEPSNPRWPGFLLFRDHLRAHPEEAAAYAAEKRRLAAAFGDDIGQYRTAKSGLVTAAMERARVNR